MLGSGKPGSEAASGMLATEGRRHAHANRQQPRLSLYSKKVLMAKTDAATQPEYSDDGFWDKVTKYAKDAGESALSPALKMYYSATDEKTPVWAKTTIYAALAYFISPVDAVPDIIPMVGYSDDVGVLVAALGATAAHITQEHTRKAKETLSQWFS